MQSVQVLMTPGIDGDYSYLKTNTLHWREKYGIISHYYSMNFKKDATADEQRTLYFNRIRDLEADVLIAVSGSGLLALDALKNFPNQIRKVILISARLRPGYFPVIPYFYTILRYPVFFSYLRSHKKILHEVPADRVLTLYSSWDEVVPASTVELKGAQNIRMLLKPRSWPFHTYFSRYAVKEYEEMLIQFISDSA